MRRVVLALAVLAAHPLAATAQFAGLPADVQAFHDAHGECDEADLLPEAIGPIVIPLGSERTMYLVPCYSGAYNVAHAAYVADAMEVKRHWFATYRDYDGWTATDIIVNPVWEGGGLGRLSMYNLGRGIGDCGSTATWQVADGNLRMLKFTYKGDCDGEGEPGEFPVVFEASPSE